MCIFAYGQTGAGKTYTMEGEPDNPGLIPRTIEMVFEDVQKWMKDGWEYATVTLSCMEIYINTVRDLIDSKNETN